MRKLIILGLIVSISTLLPWLLRTHLTTAQQISLGIFIMAAILWLTEFIPPFATAIAVIILEVFLLGRPGGPLNLKEAGLADSYQIFLNPIASPIIILFFGGLILAAAATKTGADRFLASRLLSYFATSRHRLLLGVMLITALFSMLMSNVAACVMMFAITTPLLAAIHKDDSYRKQIALGIPIAANLGGLGTIIGTPPNAIAVTMLATQGISISFLGWLLIGTPFVAIMLLVSAWIISVAMPSLHTHDSIVFEKSQPAASTALFVLAIAGITFLLWILEPIHKLSAPIVALLPVLLFTTTGIFTAEDLRRLDWDVLLLVAGGLSLGVSLQTSGLLNKLQELLYPFTGFPAMSYIIFVGVTLLLSNFMSNTSAASIIIPLTASGILIDRSIGTFLVTFTVSLAMSLPVSTPTNSIAFTRGALKTKDFLSVGTAVSLAGIVIGGCYLLLLKQSGVFDFLIKP